MNLTKTETRTIFDKTKIKKNDVVIVPVTIPKGFLGSKEVRVFGMVNEVHDTYITVKLASSEPDDINNYIIETDRANEISIVQSALDFRTMK